MAKREDLTGQRFGRLTVIEPAPTRYIVHYKQDGTPPKMRGYTMWKCRCDCGAERIVYSNNLKAGAVKSCGCLRKELTADRMLEIGKRQRKPKEA